MWYRFRDVARYWSKIASFTFPPVQYLSPQFRATPLKFDKVLSCRKMQSRISVTDYLMIGFVVLT